MQEDGGRKIPSPGGFRKWLDAFVSHITPYGLRRALAPAMRDAYTVTDLGCGRGVYGHMALRGTLAKLKYRPAFFWEIVSMLSQLYVWHRPEKAFMLVATWRRKKG